jgi:hypothetical protein
MWLLALEQGGLQDHVAHQSWRPPIHSSTHPRNLQPSDAQRKHIAVTLATRAEGRPSRQPLGRTRLSGRRPRSAISGAASSICTGASGELETHKVVLFLPECDLE